MSIRRLLTGKPKLNPAKPVKRKKRRRALKKPKQWAYGSLRTEAHTRSEARAGFKRQLKLKSNGRLPAGSFIALVKDPNRQ